MVKKLCLGLILVFVQSGTKIHSQSISSGQKDARHGDLAWERYIRSGKLRNFDKQFCNVRPSFDYSLYSKGVFDKKYLNQTPVSAIFKWYRADDIDTEIASKVNKLMFRNATRKSFDNENFYVNVRILHYLGLKLDDFRKLRWFFSKEDIALYPEKLYSHFRMLSSVSKRYDYNKVFIDRFLKGVPVIVYEYNKTSCYYIDKFSKLNHDFLKNKRFKKIIYLKFPNK